MTRDCLLLCFAATACASTLQQAADEAMCGRAGSVVILDVQTGKPLAIAHREVAERSFGAPGSAIKPFTLAAMLESGVLPDRPYFACPGKLFLAGRNLTCTHPPFPAAPDAAAALAYSCNNFFVHFAADLPERALAEKFAKFGIGNAARPSSLERRELQAIGEGIRVSPMELARAYRQLALRKLRGDVKLAPVFTGLENAVRFGTGQNAKWLSLAIAGKTGTTTGHAWFAGYAPADAPTMAFAIMLRAGTGGGDAAPLARQILAPAEPGIFRIGNEEVGLEDYVAGVLAGECSTFTSVEAIKAMAVAVRTFAVRFRGRHQQEGFDFCATTHCQNFRPEAVTARLRDAADATAGELLWYRGSPAATHYSQDCGGVSEGVRYVWPELNAPYLRQNTDVYCTRQGRQQWSASLSKQELAKALEKAGLSGSDSGMAVVLRTPSGRAHELRLGGKLVAASSVRFAIGRSLGWNRVRSDLYDVRSDGERVIFTGHGTGHGVGLCQHGAEQMGQSGATYREILDQYYRGTTLGLTASGLAWHALSGERAELWTTTPAHDVELLRITEQLVGEAEERTKLRLDVKPRVCVFPMTAIFRDATGEPGWVAASTRGRVIRVAPAGATRATLRHEIYHVMIESRAQPQLPLWYREGLALALAGAPRASGPHAQEHIAARDRVDALIHRYGEATVVGWITRGLPPELKNASASQPVTRRK